MHMWSDTVIGENGTPETPDWTPCAGNFCGGCGFSANLCKCLAMYDQVPCCKGCTHSRIEPEVQVWQGDNA